MKNSIQYLILLFGITISSFCLGQSDAYYMDRYGVIQNNDAYKKQKEEALNSLGSSKGKQLYLFENLTKLYNREDSIVYSYNWIVTDNMEKAEKEYQNRNALVGTIFPIKNAKTLEGSVINIDDLKGKPTLINLWFTSCPPCIKEMPVLNKMKAEYGDKFNFLSITMDSKSKVNRFLEKYDFDFDHIVGSKELTTKLGFKYFPINLFLDQEGRISVFEDSVPIKEDVNGKPFGCPNKFLKILESLLESNHGLNKKE